MKLIILCSAWTQMQMAASTSMNSLSAFTIRPRISVSTSPFSSPTSQNIFLSTPGKPFSLT
ncbi:unnamed protein product [Protopolystoma xenopodis]|uniref:Uncharacterized protein n=1 Tax=Protopolystoma xenopodis TaxID=117903 RepID=A0A448WNY2_9PLAT|nr:unnamed protein product [Protopolystoma xenopodis]